MSKYFLPSFLLLLSSIPLQAIDASDLHCEMSALSTNYIKREYSNKYIEPTINVIAPQGSFLKLKGDSDQDLSNCHFHITDATGKNLDDKVEITSNLNILQAEDNILPFSFRIQADDLPQNIEIDCLASLFTAKGYRLSEAQSLGEKGKFSLEGIDMTYSRGDVFGEEGLGFKATGNIELLKQIVFYDQQGKEIEPTDYCKTRNQRQVGILFNFAKLQEVATAKLKMFDEPQDIQLPIKIKVVSSVTANAAEGQAQDKINCELGLITKAFNTDIFEIKGLTIILQCKAKKGEVITINKDQQVNAKVEGSKGEKINGDIRAFFNYTDELTPHQLPILIHFTKQVPSSPSIKLDDAITITHAQELRETEALALRSEGEISINDMDIHYKQFIHEDIIHKDKGRRIEILCSGATEQIFSFNFYDAAMQPMSRASHVIIEKGKNHIFQYQDEKEAAFLKIKYYRKQEDLKVPFQFEIKHDATIL